jgi:DNA-binding PadR family transcriptional regulator
MVDSYKPIREMGISKRSLAQGTLTKWTVDLEQWGLITIDNPKNNRKDKIYTITDDGIFTLKFITATTKTN